MIRCRLWIGEYHTGHTDLRRQLAIESTLRPWNIPPDRRLRIRCKEEDLLVEEAVVILDTDYRRLRCGLPLCNLTRRNIVDRSTEDRGVYMMLKSRPCTSINVVGRLVLRQLGFGTSG